jgi:hypothetical protein
LSEGDKMEVALIPPMSGLSYNMDRPLQMMLPAGTKHIQYRTHYHYLTEWDGAHVILDNGMFESGKPTTFESLVATAALYKVDEIVVPDVRAEMIDTMKMAEEFYHFADGFLQDLKLMVVPQGCNVVEVCECVDAHVALLAQCGFVNYIVGVPRWLGEDLYPEARLSVIEHVYRCHPGVQVHLLGLNRRMPTDIRYVVEAYRGIARGVDTDAPFVWASHGSLLADVVDIGYQRPKNYLSLTADKFPVDLVNKNIRTLLEWARG